MSEKINKAFENSPKNSLIDEFIKLGINRENVENKTNYSNSNSNKKDMAFNYYFGNNPVNPNLQLNSNFIQTNFSQLENYYKVNENKSEINQANPIPMNLNFNNIHNMNQNQYNSFNDDSSNFSQFYKYSVENNFNFNNNNNNYNSISNIGNLPLENLINSKNSNLSNIGFCNNGKDQSFTNPLPNEIMRSLNNKNNSNFNQFQKGFQQKNKYSENVNSNTVNYYNNSMHPNLNLHNNINMNINNNIKSPKGNHRNNKNYRTDKANQQMNHGQNMINIFPNMNFHKNLNFNMNNQNNMGNHNQNDYFQRMKIMNKQYNQSINLDANNPMINMNMNNLPLNHMHGMPHRNANLNDPNSRNIESPNYFNEEAYENKDIKTYQSQDNKNDYTDNNQSNLNNNKYRKKINNMNKNMINNKAETNESYLLTNPNLLNAKINSSITLNVNNGTRYFIIKSVDEDNIHKSIKYNIWCSTIKGNQKLQKAFKDSNGNFPIYLLFSVNGSGRFLGVAQMISDIEYRANFNYWSQSEKWKGFFFVKWIYIKDIPNRAFRNLINEYNDNKPVTTSRDTQEISPLSGTEMIKIFNEYVHESSILDDFNFFEVKQENVTQKVPSTQQEKSSNSNNIPRKDESNNQNNNKNNKNTLLIKDGNVNIINDYNDYYKKNSLKINQKEGDTYNYSNNPINIENYYNFNSQNHNIINKMNLIYNQNNIFNIQQNPNLAFKGNANYSNSDINDINTQNFDIDEETVKQRRYFDNIDQSVNQGNMEYFKNNLKFKNTDPINFFQNIENINLLNSESLKGKQENQMNFKGFNNHQKNFDGIPESNYFNINNNEHTNKNYLNNQERDICDTNDVFHSNSNESDKSVSETLEICDENFPNKN